MFITRNYTSPFLPDDEFRKLAADKIAPKIDMARHFFENEHGKTPQEIRAQLSLRMSEFAAHIRSAENIHKIKDEAVDELQTIAQQTVLNHPEDLIVAFENVDLLLAQWVYVAAMEDYINTRGGSRGSFVIPDANGTTDIPGLLKFTSDNGRLSSKIQEITCSSEGFDIRWENVRPVPQHDAPFEIVWREYRKNEAKYKLKYT